MREVEGWEGWWRRGGDERGACTCPHRVPVRARERQRWRGGWVVEGVCVWGGAGSALHRQSHHREDGTLRSIRRSSAGPVRESQCVNEEITHFTCSHCRSQTTGPRQAPATRTRKHAQANKQTNKQQASSCMRTVHEHLTSLRSTPAYQKARRLHTRSAH